MTSKFEVGQKYTENNIENNVEYTVTKRTPCFVTVEILVKIGDFTDTFSRTAKIQSWREEFEFATFKGIETTLRSNEAL